MCFGEFRRRARNVVCRTARVAKAPARRKRMKQGIAASVPRRRAGSGRAAGMQRGGKQRAVDVGADAVEHLEPVDVEEKEGGWVSGRGARAAAAQPASSEAARGAHQCSGVFSRLRARTRTMTRMSRTAQTPSRPPPTQKLVMPPPVDWMLLSALPCFFVCWRLLWGLSGVQGSVESV